MKKLVDCRVCGNPVAKNANKCPHCGAHTPNQKNFNAAIVGIVFIGIWIITTILSVGLSDDTDSAEQTPPPFTPPGAELTDEEKAAALLTEATAEFANNDYMDAIELCDQITTEYPDTETASIIPAYLDEWYAQFPHFNAPDLMSEYDANIVNADEEYTDAVMLITGTVNAIGKTNNDKNLTVLLDSGAYFHGVQLNFKTSQTTAVAALSKGDTITAIGKCTGISGTQFIVLSGNNVMIENCYIIND